LYKLAFYAVSWRRFAIGAKLLRIARITTEQKEKARITNPRQLFCEIKSAPAFLRDQIRASFFMI
jgi:hypothetical protein